MRKYQYLLILFLASACGKSQESALPNSLTQVQRDLIQQKVKDYPSNTQVSIAVIKNGEVSFVGLKKKDAETSWVRNHENVFEIGSISKVFTSTLLAKLSIDKKLQLNDNIDQYIETPLKGNPQISLLQLANHTSGLPRLPTNMDPNSNPSNPYKDYGEAQLEFYLSNEIEISETQKGTYLYSNLGLGLLGYILCKIEAQSYESLLQRDIFSHYAMNHSTTDRAKIKNLLISGLDQAGREIPNWDLAAMVGAGGILSSTEDLSKFALAHFDPSNQDLSLTRLSTHTVDHISDIGLSWEIIKRRSGDIWYKHNGRTGGYYAAMIIDVNNKNGLVLLSNISGYSNHTASLDDLSFDLMKSIQNQ